MPNDLLANASINIDAPRAGVWNALIDPKGIKEYMFGADVITSWKPGTRIKWKGQWKGKDYEDKGEILEITPRKRMKYTHYSALSGDADKPENYHTVTIELTDQGAGTGVTLTQDGNATETARQHSEKNWATMLEGLKKYVEQTRRS